MSAADENTQFIQLAQSQGMLTQQLANDVLQSVGANDVAATVVLQKGLMEAHQVDMIQTVMSDRLIIPGYSILDIIGHGGMGVVYRARQNTLEREVALKTILVGARIDEALQRFRKEARSIAKLNHPNIVTAFDSGQHDGRIFLSMELVEGQNLHDYVTERRILSEAEALDFTRQAALGLAHAWEHGIVHRDVKPDNLLITNPSEIDQTRAVKISDLGLALLNSDTEARITQTGAAVGSPLYMSPEQLNGDPVDCRTDIYSLGSTLYFMLSGQPPFDGDSIGTVMFSKASGKVIPLDEVVDVSEETQKLVGRMMHVDPNRRIPDYRSAVHAIDTVLKSVGPTASTPTSSPKTQPSASSANPALLNTQVLNADTCPNAGTEATPRSASIPLWIPILAVAIIAFGTYFLLPQQASIDSAPVQQIEMTKTWEEPLFSGSSLNGWTSSSGTELTIKPSPEGATGLSLNATQNRTGHVSRSIPQPDGHSAWFEFEVQLILGSADSGGVLFDVTDSAPRYRILVTATAATLVDETTGKPVAPSTELTSARERPVSIVLRLQPNGWQTEVNGHAMRVVPRSEPVKAAIQLFTEGGETFFTDLYATGLAVAEQQPLQ